jgi:hypothetical protein
MTWMTWRQFRAQAVAAAAILAVLAIALAITGSALAADASRAGLPACQANCGAVASAFLSQIKAGVFPALFYAGIVLMYLAPGLIGIFWGAPLIAREFEAGTSRLGWSQSVTRTRWTLTKLALIGLAAMAAAGLLSLMVTWWASPINDALQYSSSGISVNVTRMEPIVFGARGVVPLGYAALAFVLGVTVGVLIRRTVAAMAITLAAFVAVQVLVPILVRPHLLAPEQATRPLNPAINEMIITSTGQMTLIGPASVPGGWVLTDQTITPAGRVFTGPATSACAGQDFQACSHWIAGQHLRQLITYQPASRFWPLQWIETAMYMVLAIALGGICVWQVRRRV